MNCINPANTDRANLAAQFRPSGRYGRPNNMQLAREAAVMIHNGATDPEVIRHALTPAEPPKFERPNGKRTRKRIIIVTED